MLACLQKKAEAGKDEKDGHRIFLPDFKHDFFTKANDADAVEKETLGNRVDDAVGFIRGILEKWPIPRVRDGRAMQWRSDEEFARAVRPNDTHLARYTWHLLCAMSY